MVVDHDLLKDTHTDDIKSTSEHVSGLVFPFSSPPNPAKHVSVDCTITLLHFGVVERSVKLVWVSFSNNANAHNPCGSLSALDPYHFTLSGCA